MIGNHKTMRRLATGFALAAVTAAIAAPAGLARSKPDYGPLDAWAVSYMSGNQPDAWAVKYLTPGGPNGLPDAWAVKYFNPAPSYGKPDAWAVKYVTPIHIPATLLNPPAQITTGSNGFDLASFGIGIGAGIGALLILGAFAVRFGKLRQLASA